MIHKRAENLTKADIDDLVQHEVPEQRQLDYKRELHLKTDKQKKDFLANVSSFANSSGGYLLFGIEETSGVPRVAQGLPDEDLDKLSTAIEGILRYGLSPRLSNYSYTIKPIEGFPKGPVVALQIGKSWRGPHMITFKKWSRFYTRNNSGKHPMDITEIRDAFAQSDAIPTAIRSFADERLRMVRNRETYQPLADGPKTLLHIIPYVARSGGFSLPALELQTAVAKLQPIPGGSADSRFNLEGYVSWDSSDEDHGPPKGYCQVFRDGTVEAIQCERLIPQPGGTELIPGTAWTRDVLKSLRSYLDALEMLNVPLPVVIIITLWGFNGAYFGVEQKYAKPIPSQIDRPVLRLPEILVEDYGADIFTLLRPAMDALWNSVGYPNCKYYDDDGNWRESWISV